MAPGQLEMYKIGGGKGDLCTIGAGVTNLLKIPCCGPNGTVIPKTKSPPLITSASCSRLTDRLESDTTALLRDGYMSSKLD